MAHASASPSRRVALRHPWGIAAGLLALAAIAVWLIIQSGGATVVSQARAVARFNSIELVGSNAVSVRVGASQSVVVRARESELGLITTQVSGRTLVIANDPTPHGTKGPISVSISVPSLQSLAIPGSGVVRMSGIDASSFTVTIGGSGLVQASGKTARLNVSIGGSGDAELGQLVARDVHASLSGSGQIVVTATGGLDASVSGDGVIRYGGNPARLSTRVTGHGVIIPG